MSDDGGAPVNAGLQQALLNSQINAANAGGGGGEVCLQAKALSRTVLGADLEGDGDHLNVSKFSSSMSMQAAAPGAALNGESLLAKVFNELVQLGNQDIPDHTAGVGGSPHSDGAAMPGAAGGGEGGSASGDYEGETGSGSGSTHVRAYAAEAHHGSAADVTPEINFTALVKQDGGRGGGGRSSSSGGGGGPGPGL